MGTKIFTLLSALMITTTHHVLAEEFFFIKGAGGGPRALSKLDSDTGTVTELLPFDAGAEFLSNSTPQLDASSGKIFWQSFKPVGGLSGDSFLHIYDPATNTLEEIDTADGETFSLTQFGISGGRDSLIRRADDGSIHIGENSLITIEQNGRQSLFAQDANSNPIDIDINNGSDLLVNGISVMGSIRGLGEGLKATTAMNAALSAVPSIASDSQYECGMGAGGYDNKHAIAASCGFRASENTTFNLGFSHLTSGSEQYLVDELSSYVVRAGFSFKFGGPSKNYSSVAYRHDTQPSPSSDNQIENERIVELERETMELRQELGKLKERESQSEELMQQIAEFKEWFASMPLRQQ